MKIYIIFELFYTSHLSQLYFRFRQAREKDNTLPLAEFPPAVGIRFQGTIHIERLEVEFLPAEQVGESGGRSGGAD